jgi:hypothetical protein
MRMSVNGFALAIVCLVVGRVSGTISADFILEHGGRL